MNEDDLVAVTDGVTTDNLILAYNGFTFPWPIDGEDFTPWFSPDPRGILEFKNFHISKSLKKFLKNTNLTVTFCKDFDAVIEACAKVKRKDQEGTWINSDILPSYKKLFKLKKAYSVEVWSYEKELVGGLYGVISDRYLSGESMFFLKTGASKLALVSLVERLEKLGLSFLDTQMVTPLLASFGGEEVSKKEFRNIVEKSTLLGDDFFDLLSGDQDGT